EEVDSRYVGADRKNASGAGLWLGVATCGPERRDAGFSRPESIGLVFQPSIPPALVPECDLQTRHVGWPGSQQPSRRTQDSEKVSAGTQFAPADRRGGESIPGGLRPPRRTDRSFGDLRGNASRRDSRA